jgi:hypothetical protein
MIPREISRSDCARVSFSGGPDEKGVAGIVRDQRSNAGDPRCARIRRGIENFDALVFRIDPNEDQRSPVFMISTAGRTIAGMSRMGRLWARSLVGASGCPVTQPYG